MMTEKPPSPVVETRHITDFVKLLLFVRSAGRCEFAGCNDNILEHEVTLREGNYAQMAHIVAFRPDGPRGRDGERPEQINSVSNLMLLCHKCHKLIDDNPSEYPRARLEVFKAEHEARIARLAELGPELKTATLVLKAPIGGNPVEISEGQVATGLLPRYPASRKGRVVDLNNLAQIGETDAYLQSAKESLDARISTLFDPEGEPVSVGHLSVFALGPIPLLVHLGGLLSNKVPTDLFQRHRDTEDWVWKVDGPPVAYRHALVREGRPGGGASLILSLSGSVPLDTVTAVVDDAAWVFELTLEGRAPDPTFLRQRSDLDRFRAAYQAVLGDIVAQVGLVEAIDLFPAIPAPVAVLCGRERLPKAHPALKVYDFDRERGGFIHRLTVG